MNRLEDFVYLIISLGNEFRESTGVCVSAQDLSEQLREVITLKERLEVEKKNIFFTDAYAIAVSNFFPLNIF